MSLSRRSFLAGGGCLAALFAVGGAGALFPKSVSLLRPPGAQDEGSLLSVCIKCDRCRSVCPEKAIDVAHVEDGILQARTPYLNFKKGYCTFCEGAFLCARVCPVSALGSFDPMRDKIGIAVVEESECLLYRSGSGSCSKNCIDACEYSALSLDEGGRLVVNAESCNGCGACECSCPSSSYGNFTASGKRGINVEVLGGVS